MNRTPVTIAKTKCAVCLKFVTSGRYVLLGGISRFLCAEHLAAATVTAEGNLSVTRPGAGNIDPTYSGNVEVK